MRLIDADAFLKDVLPECKYPDALREAVERQPTIEAEPVRHGRWETWGYVFHGIEWKRCSCCGKCADVSYYGLLDGEIRMSTPDTCGCCGARMDGGTDNG